MILIVITFCFMLSRSQSQSCVMESLLPRDIHSHQVAYDSVSHFTYLFGGLTDSNNVIETIYKRHMDQTDWITLNVVTPGLNPFYSYTQNSVLVDRIVYFIGIMDSPWNSDFQTGTIYKFDINTEDWLPNAQLTAPPYPSVFGCLTTNETHLFMIGGSSCNTCFDERLQMYNINDDSWVVEVININQIQGNGWDGQYCQMVENELFVFGGYVGNIGYIDGLFKYNTLEWSTLPSVLPSVAGYGATIHKHPYIYLFGGSAGGGIVLNTIVQFDIKTESIINTYTMQESLYSVDAEIVNGKVYIFGGKIVTSKTNSASVNVEQCDILETTPSDDPGPSTSPSKHPSYNPSTPPSRHSREPSISPPSLTMTSIVTNYSITIQIKDCSAPCDKNQIIETILNAIVDEDSKLMGTVYDGDMVSITLSVETDPDRVLDADVIKNNIEREVIENDLQIGEVTVEVKHNNDTSDDLLVPDAMVAVIVCCLLLLI
eukprot:306081_1